MVSLTMMARLLEAVRPDARLVFVGDPDQLASVDAGAVLTDLVRGFGGGPDSPVGGAAPTHRYGREIRALAEALRLGDADAAIEALRGGHEQRRRGHRSRPGVGDPRDSLPAALAVRDAAPRRATSARRSPRSTGTGCCAPTATDRSACATGTGGSSMADPGARRPALRVGLTSGGRCW